MSKWLHELVSQKVDLSCNCSIGTSWMINFAYVHQKKPICLYNLHFHVPTCSMKHHFGHKKVVPFGEIFSRAPCRSKPANFKRFRAASEPSNVSWKRVLLVLTSCRQGQIIVEFPMERKVYVHTHTQFLKDRWKKYRNMKIHEESGT